MLEISICYAFDRRNLLASRKWCNDMFLSLDELHQTIVLNRHLSRNRLILKLIGISIVISRITMVFVCVLKFVPFRSILFEFVQTQNYLFGCCLFFWLLFEFVFQYCQSHLVTGLIGLQQGDYIYILDERGLLKISDDKRQALYSLTLKQYEDLSNEMTQILLQVKNPKLKILPLCLNDFLVNQEIKKTC